MANRPVATPILKSEHLRAIDETLKKRLTAMPVDKALTLLIDSVDASVLPFIAEQFDLLGDKGFGLTTDEQERRLLIKNALKLHRYRGTVFAIKEAAKFIGFDSVDIVEGPQEYEAQYGDRYVHTFKIELNADDYQDPISAAQIQLLTRLVMIYKNARSKLVDVAYTVSFEDEFNGIQDDSLLIDIAPLFTENYKFSANIYDGTFNYDGTITYGADTNNLIDITCVVNPSIVDADAQAYIDLTEIDACNSYAVHNLVNALKDTTAYGLVSFWEACQFIYPFYGDGINQPLSFQHSIDLRRPALGLAGGQMIFSGSPIHSLDGIIFDGSVSGTIPGNQTASGGYGSFDADNLRLRGVGLFITGSDSLSDGDNPYAILSDEQLGGDYADYLLSLKQSPASDKIEGGSNSSSQRLNVGSAPDGFLSHRTTLTGLGSDPVLDALFVDGVQVATTSGANVMEIQDESLFTGKGKIGLLVGLYHPALTNYSQSQFYNIFNDFLTAIKRV